MKKWKEYMMLAVLCIGMVGCGKRILARSF